MELITGYDYPEVLNVTRAGRTNGDPTVDWTYDDEMSKGRWDPDLLPFHHLGDLSYYCLRISAGETSSVYVRYFYGEQEEIAPSFEDWLREHESFLNG